MILPEVHVRVHVYTYNSCTVRYFRKYGNRISISVHVVVHVRVVALLPYSVQRIVVYESTFESTKVLSYFRTTVRK